MRPLACPGRPSPERLPAWPPATRCGRVPYMGAARLMTDRVDELTAAVVPHYGRADLERALAELRGFAALDPRGVFGHRVSEHRDMIAKLDVLMATLNVVSGPLLRAAEPDHAFNRDLQLAIQQACTRLRTVRALAAVLSGARKPVEDAAIGAQVRALLEERGAAAAAALSPEEVALVEAPCRSLDAWLNEA